MSALSAKASAKPAAPAAARPASPVLAETDVAPVGNLALQDLLAGGLRPKLAIGGADDPEERAADALAAQAFAGSKTPCACGAPCPKCTGQNGGIDELVRRKADPAAPASPQSIGGTSVFCGVLPVRARPAAPVQHDEPQYVITPVAGTAQPLAQYAALREHLSPGDWNALNAAARRRTDKILAGQEPPRESEVVKSEVQVSLDTLLQPPVTGSFRSGDDQWLRDMFALGSAGTNAAVNSAAMGIRLQREILGRWISKHPGLLQEMVTIALVDPEGRAGSPATVLSFSLQGKPIRSSNGILTLAAVDKAFDNDLSGMMEEIKPQLSDLTRALEKNARCQAMLDAAKSLAARKHESVATNTLTQVDTALREALAGIDSVAGEPFASLVSPTKSALRSFIDEGFAKYRIEHTSWTLTHPREVSVYERQVDTFSETLDEQKRMMKGDIWDRMASGYVGTSAYYQAQSFGTMNLLTGGSKEQERQLGQAYDRGDISYDQWKEGVDAASTRGNIFLAVTAALTIATLGLGLYIGPGLSLGGSIAFGAGTGFVTAAGPMIASNMYTSSVDLSDPEMQRWWKSGSYSTGDILLAGGLGAGLGAAFPIASRLAGSFNARGATAVAALAAGEALPEGVVARSVGKGVVELTIASEGVTIRVTSQGYKVFGPAGSNPRALLADVNWADSVVGEGVAQSGRIDILHPQFPTAVAMTGRGWGVHSPFSARPLQFGLWDELLLGPGASGAAQPARTVSPLLLEAAAGRTVTPTAGGQGALVLAEAHIPYGLPAAPQPFPSFLHASRFPALPAGPQPFGLLAPPAPRVDYLGPLVPPSFEQSITTQWGTSVAQRGTSMLPWAGEGAVWLQLPSGEWAPAYYGYRPGGIPGASLATYGTAAPDFLVDVPGSVRSGLVVPRPGGSYAGPRSYPMATSAMFDPTSAITYGRGHLVPHAQTKPAGPGQVLSTLDPRNFVAHPRKYNEWIRNQLEQSLKRRGATYTAHDVIGESPQLTSGGYIIPEAEIFVEYGPSGAPVRAWRFPFNNPNYYNTLSGSFEDVIGKFEIGLPAVPSTRIGQ